MAFTAECTSTRRQVRTAAYDDRAPPEDDWPVDERPVDDRPTDDTTRLDDLRG